MRQNKQPVLDILQEKVNDVARLQREANSAIDLVVRTMTNLESINQELDDAIAEIDAYTEKLAATRAAMNNQRKHNTAIVGNFAKLLEIDAGDTGVN